MRIMANILQNNRVNSCFVLIFCLNQTDSTKMFGTIDGHMNHVHHVHLVTVRSKSVPTLFLKGTGLMQKHLSL